MQPTYDVRTNLFTQDRDKYADGAKHAVKNVVVLNDGVIEVSLHLAVEPNAPLQDHLLKSALLTGHCGGSCLQHYVKNYPT